MSVMTIGVGKDIINAEVLDLFDMLSFLKNDCLYTPKKIKAETKNLILFEGVDSNYGKSLVYVNKTSKKFYINSYNKGAIF